jgi:Nuclear condensing complex subunits, C-term domain
VLFIFLRFENTKLEEQTFEENSTLEGILGELIIPAVKRKELILREKGLVSLGLCCLIAKVNEISGCSFHRK